MAEPIPGLWYEVARNRWRVKLCKDGEIYHRSYHRSYEVAYDTWKTAKKTVLQPPDVAVMASGQALTPIAKFLRQPPPGLAELY
jgi:hypothetical protein